MTARASKRNLKSPRRPQAWKFSLCLALLVIVTYAGVRQHDFINFDDPQYVFENIHVRDGVSGGGIKWAFASGYAGNWHPLTWISHMIDVDIHGLDAGAHHVTNLLFHTANTLLLFLVLLRLTGAAGPSALVAGLFGLHPLHVESVAWVSERKDVLSTFFWMLTLLAYVKYVERPAVGRYVAVVILFACGLMSKPTLVTLPLVLLLLDGWPLARTGAARLVREKLPLVAMSAAAGVVTLLAQQQAGAVRTLDALPLAARIENATVAYVGYLWKMLWPVNLAALYPYDRALSPWLVGGAALLLVAVSAIAMAASTRRKAPFVAVGWGWYLITLAPMIGLVQVGSQPMADRYTYVPLIGIFIAVAWSLQAAVARLEVPKRALVALSTVLLLLLALLTARQAALWRDSVTLWAHAVAVTGDNYRARTNLGHALGLRGQWHDALPQLEEAVRITDDAAEPQHYLGQTLAALGRLDGALVHYRRAVALSPAYAEAHGNLGIALAQGGEPEEGLRHIREAVRLEPGSPVGRANLAMALTHAGAALANDGQIEKAAGYFTEAITHDPGLVDAHANLAVMQVRRGRLDEAITAYREARRLQPGNDEWQRRIDLIDAQKRGGR